MKEFWLKAKEWWSNLALREKQAVSVGGVLLALFIIYQWMWMPALNGVESLRQKIVAGQKTLVWMESVDKQIQKMEGQSTDKQHASTLVVLLSQMKKQINRAGLEPYLTQLKQANNSSIEAHFKKVEFAKLVDMLAASMKELSMSVTHLVLTPTETPGYVNADMVIKQG